VLISICPTENCKYRSLARKRDKKITCKQCNQSFCPQCKLEPHYQQTCEQAFETSNDKSNVPYCSPRAEALIKKLNAGEVKFSLCPKCNMRCERVKGCDLVDCNSEFCQGATSFCIKCKQLVKTRHMPHRCGVQAPEQPQIPFFLDPFRNIS